MNQIRLTRQSRLAILRDIHLLLSMTTGLLGFLHAIVVLEYPASTISSDIVPVCYN